MPGLAMLSQKLVDASHHFCDGIGIVAMPQGRGNLSQQLGGLFIGNDRFQGVAQTKAGGMCGGINDQGDAMIVSPDLVLAGADTMVEQPETALGDRNSAGQDAQKNGAKGLWKTAFELVQLGFKTHRVAEPQQVLGIHQPIDDHGMAAQPLLHA